MYFLSSDWQEFKSWWYPAYLIHDEINTMLHPMWKYKLEGHSGKI